MKLPELTRGRRVLVIVLTIILVLARQFMAEALHWLNWRFYYLLSNPSVKSVMDKINARSPVNLSNYWLYSKGLFLIVHYGCLFLLIACLFNSRKHLRLAVTIMASWLVGTVVLNLVGRLAHIDVLLDFARLSFDTSLEPFAEAFLIPVLLLLPPVTAPENKIFKKF